ncbi:hypothetical protein, partial [Bradyrhizobium sp.]|uniref:hypothetical protein n=1 Tax=Bradyrhizobium sp. TaxID=376 RepID=UPI003C254ACE
RCMSRKVFRLDQGLLESLTQGLNPLHVAEGLQTVGKKSLRQQGSAGGKSSSVPQLSVTPLNIQ